MPSFGLLEMLVIGVVLLIFVGPEDMPKLVRNLGRLYGRLRRNAEELRRAFILEADRMDEEERLKQLRRKREEAEQRRRDAEADDPTGARAQPQPDTVVEGPADDDPPPDGISPEAWSETPEDVRRILRRKADRGDDDAPQPEAP